MTETAQLDAILYGAAFAEVTDRAFLRITGPDATRWLNGMVTNNIKDLAPGEGNYNFLLNAQGRIQGDCTIYREPNDGPATFLLETENSQLETLHQTLDKFIIMDDVELEPEPVRGPGILLIGHDAPKLLERFGLDSLKALRMARTQNSLVVAPPLRLLPSYELYSETPFDLAGVVEVSAETLEALRIYSGTPKYGVDIRNTETARDLPQETAQTHALNFNKGCYLGQEIVERIHSRGSIHRTFTRFTLSGKLPALPATLEANGKPAGELTSAAQIGDTIYALGYARREALDTHAPLTYPGGTANLRT